MVNASWIDRHRTLVQIAVVVAGVVLGVLAYRVQMEDLQVTTRARATASVVAGWAFLLVGIVAWRRRPGTPMGPLMLATAFALLCRQFRYSHDSAVFTTFFLAGELGYALFAHTALAYPSGRVTDRLERAFLAVVYVVVLVFPVAVLMTYDGTHPLRYHDALARESVLYAFDGVDISNAVQNAYALTAYGGLAALFVVLVVRKLLRATPRARRMLLPVLLAAPVAALRAIFDALLTFSAPPAVWVLDNLFWWQIVGIISVPLAMLVGLLRARFARLNVAGLVVELERTPPEGIRDALARALDDPSLDVALYLAERGYVDALGRQLVLPSDDPTRSVTTLEHDGRQLAALVHDPSLDQEPKLVEAVGAAAALALENARLHAEVQAQLATVKESRARLVAAGDEQRRRIERDLHDGAQQQLVALALELRRAKREAAGTMDPEVERLLGSTADELQSAVERLRELAAGIHPSVLTQGGLTVALEALARKAPVPVAVNAPLERLAPDVEVTAYYLASEALQNVAKHAHATRATLGAYLENGRLVVEVVDDGVGGAAANGSGSGLRGLTDRVEALGGTVVVDSPSGGGTRVVGEIPCAS